MMNLQELLDEMDVFRKITGIRLQDVYNLMLQRGWTLGSAQMLPVMHARDPRAYHSPAGETAAETTGGTHQPDMVVSVIPNFNRALFDAAARSARRSDGDDPDRHGGLSAALLDRTAAPVFHLRHRERPTSRRCSWDSAGARLSHFGHDSQSPLLRSGKRRRPGTSAATAKRSGWIRHLPTALMMFGGEGSTKMLDIARSLNRSGLELQIIAICGKNQKLRSGSASLLPGRIRIHVEGFTREVPRFMRLADFFIGKPGPGSISEAVAMGLPVIVESNQWTLPQERYNAKWVEEQGVGIALKSFRRQVVDAVRRMIDPEQRAEFVARVGKLNNRAIFEIPDILEKIMSNHR